MRANGGPSGPSGTGLGASLTLAGRGTLPKSARVRTRREYEQIQRQGIRLSHRDFTVVCCRSLAGSEAGARFGCAVSRKVGGAVVRNRLKRLMREVFRQCRERLPSVDLVVILRPEAARWAELGLDGTARELLPAFAEAARRALREHGRKRHRGRGRKGSSAGRAAEERGRNCPPSDR